MSDQISFETSFPGGNGILQSVANDSSGWRVNFFADPRNCPQPMWFHFRLRFKQGTRQPIRCHMVNADQSTIGTWEGTRPVFRTPDLPWQRVATAVTTFTDTGRMRAEWTIIPPVEGVQEVEFAHCFPYQDKELEATLGTPGIGSAWQQEIIGVTQKGRPLRRLHNRAGVAGDSTTPGIYILARQHAGETPGSLVLDGILRHLARRPDRSEAALIWTIPFVNYDDVVEGSFGKDPWPFDCARAWDWPYPRRAEILAAAWDIGLWKQRCKPMLVLDLHAPGTSERNTYLFLPKSKDCPEHRKFAEAYYAAQPPQLRGPYAWKDPKAPTSAQGAGGKTLNEWVAQEVGCLALTPEYNYQGSAQKAFSLEDYHLLADALMDTCFNYLAEANPALASYANISQGK